MAHLNPFRRAAAEAVASALGLPVSSFNVTAPPDPTLGDYAVGCFPAAAALKSSPAALAERVAGAFVPSEWLRAAKASGPYVNFEADRARAFGTLFAATLGPGARPIPTEVGAGKTVCIDFSSPNIAKHLAYHHIRSTVIGQALVRLHRALGYRVVGINHLGDWGTTHGINLAAYHRFGASEPLTVSTLNDLYVRYRAAMKEDPALEAEGRAWFKKLEEGDQDARKLWLRFREVSLAEYQEVYDLLGVTFDEVRGESDYEGAMPGVIRDLEAKGLTSISEGALVVDLTAEKMPPLLLRKSDGTTLYGTRDLAAALYRHERYAFDKALYVVDKGQALHFRQFAAVLRKAGHDWADRIQHVAFGLVRIGGKKSGTRAGNVVLLREVLAEAQGKIIEKLRETSPELPAPEAAAIAHDVGIGAIVFANLSSQREKDIDFEWSDVLSFEGDSGPYVQYAHARTASVLRKGGVAETAELAGASIERLADPEWRLAALLLDLPDETARACATQEPHVVARYLLEVCAAFSRWYTLGNQDPALKVLCADPVTARARLALTAATRTTLRTGLELLGMAAPQSI